MRSLSGILLLLIICNTGIAQMADESLYGSNPILQHILSKQFALGNAAKPTATKQRLVGCAYKYHTDQDSIYMGYSGSRGSDGFDFSSHAVLYFPTKPFPEQVMKFDRITNVPYGDGNCYTYDAQDNALTQTYCSGGSNIWLFITNLNGKRSLVERVDSSNPSLKQDKYSFSYNASGDLAQYTVIVAPAYDSVRKVKYSYNTAGLMVRAVAYNKQGGGWLAADSTINTYDVQGRLTESLTRDDLNITINAYSYIASTGKVYTHKYSVYPVNPGAGSNACYRYDYDASDRVVLVRTVDCADSNMVTERKVNTYDSLGNVAGRTYQKVVNGNTQPAYRTEKYYYENYQTTAVGSVTTARAGIQVYPNPASGVLNVNNTAPGTVTISNMVGQVLLRQAATSGNMQIEISAIPSGSYIITVQQADGLRLGSARFTKN